MFSINSLPEENRLEIQISDYHDEEDLKTILFIMRQEVSGLGAGWTAVADLRGMRVLEQRFTHYISRIQKLMLAHGVLRIATLVDNTILKMQITRIGNETGTNRITARFTRESEWRRFINTPPRLDNHENRDLF